MIICDLCGKVVDVSRPITIAGEVQAQACEACIEELTEQVREQRAHTQKALAELLRNLVEKNVKTLLSIPGVYEAVSEHFNNEGSATTTR